MERATNIIVVVALTLATAAIYAVSMRANYLYGYGIGQSPETKFAIAWANVGADLWKGFGLIVAVGLWRANSRRATALTGATWFACLLFSVSSAIGVYVQERSGMTSGREAQRISYQDAERELHKIDDALKADTDRASVAQVEASIAVILATPVFAGEIVRGTVATVSLNCTKHVARTAQPCAQIARLRGDLARAVETARLEQRASALREILSALRERGGAAAPDPVGEFWSWLSRGFLSAKDVGFGLPLAFAIMVEMVSAFGPFGIVAYVEATRIASERDMSRRSATAHDTSWLLSTMPEADGGGQVIAYIAERTEPTDNSESLGVGELFADYRAWCARARNLPLEIKEFVRAFDRLCASAELRGTIKKLGHSYVGIALVAEEMRGRS
jgi:hypothetical protein